ncbi:hypothetical protein TWF694_008743 [Orbilia ellipsospora]|uniref:Uncharacterized protein n=1 Tax=Orbilia ellipsospora TaxID=2528407 RepID=A0AAV9XDD4_9PEZI
MHRLLTKKHRDDEHAKPTNKLRSFKRNKSQPPPVTRPQVDLTQALPPTDDFRISLMMPNLEKRFSVLREGEGEGFEDGPGVHGIGYGALASGTMFNDGKDNDFVKPPQGNAGLADITEVASIRSGSREEGSFDLAERPSQSEDYNGSIMNRPRQGEGNVLFGGRQKIFRINTAAGGPSDDAEDSPLSPVARGRMGGRTLYTDDLPAASARKGSTTEKDQARSQSPSPSNYNLDRNTQSSTTSGPSSLTRSSTTATSNSTNSRNFTPSPFVSAMNSATSNKPRKLIYEQALDRDNIEREQRLQESSLESHKLAIMAQKRTGSSSPHPYSEEDERRRAMSPPMRSFARPFSPQNNEPELRGRSIAPVTKTQPPPNQDNLKPQMPSLKTVVSARALGTPNTPSSDVPFSFGFESNANSPKTSVPALQASVDNYGLPTPRPESEEYQSGKPLAPAVVTSGPTPSPSPLTERYSGNASIGRNSEVHLEETYSQPLSRKSSISDLQPQNPATEQQSTFFEASDSEREIDDGASSVYEDDPYIPFEDAFNPRVSDASPPLKPRQIVPTFPPDRQFGQPAPDVSDSETPLHDSDSPTLPPTAGLSNMIRQHLRSDSGVSSIYAPSVYSKIAEPQQEPPSLAQALASWGNEYPDYDEEAPFQPEASEASEPKPKFSIAELKKREADEKKVQEQQPVAIQKSAPMERNRSNNTMSTSDDEADEWRTQLEEKKRMLQQRLQEHSGRNSPAPGFADGNDEPPKNSILKPGMLGNMLKGKSSPSSTPDSKAMKMLGISPVMNQSKESFGRRDEDEDIAQSRPDERLRPMPHRSDMNHPHDMRPRGAGPTPGNRMPPHGHPYGHHQGPPGHPGRPYPHPGPQHQPLPNGPRSFLPMTAPPQNGPRKGAGHIPIEIGASSSSNMHREFVEQSRGGQRPQGPGMPHMQHRGPPIHGQEHSGRPEFRPPHDRSHDQRDSGHGGRSRARSNAQRPPNEAMLRSPPPTKTPMRRGPASEEDLRSRHRGPPMGMPGVAGMGPSVMTTVGTGPSPMNGDKKMQQPSKPKSSEPLQSKASIPDLRMKSDSKAPEASRERRPTNLNIPPVEVPQSRFSTEESPQSTSFVGRFRSNSKSQKISSVGMFEQDNASQPSLPSPPKLTPTPSNLSRPPIAAVSSMPGQTLAELTGSDGSNPAFQSTGAAATAREGKKTKIRKADISEPTLLHTTSQMPVSNLIDAGGKIYHKILPPGLSDSPQIRQRSGSDESTPRAPRGTVTPPQNQRTSDPDGDRTRVLRKAVSDGNSLRDRAASNARFPQARPPMPTPSPYYGSEARPINSPPAPFFNNAPAGMI